jgi:hypothetical protein
LGLLTEACARLGDVSSAAQLYARILPAASNYVVIGFGAGFLGSVSRYLGLLAEVLEHFDDAARHFEFAIQQDLHVGASKLAAQSKYDYSQLLLQRGRPEDRRRGEALLEEAIETATRLELQRLHERALELKNAWRTSEAKGP